MLMKADPSKVAVYDPRGALRFENVPTSARKKDLKKLRLGILDNSKWNANKLLRGAAAALGEDIEFAAVNYYVKHSFSKDAAPELIEKIASENDVVLTAIGDCGSCCSACVRDSIALEKLGIPSAVIITTEFVRETELTRQAVGMKTLEPVVITHPVSSITAEEVAQRVAQIREQAQKVWLGTQPPLQIKVDLQ
ncbi:UGSC family (seleno)protein [Ottowia thiooxydans]|uniref:UGSC family (seleno)protein n=1 Tax=Ottowia thiooxydans TaxID=219182 RepID=UPI000426D368|nr:UGSC family (seleno)protein [Ottowia thiooxydans]